MQFRRRSAIVAAVLASLLLAGCAGGTGMSSLSSVFARSKPGDSPSAAATSLAELPPDFECPSVTIRQGASTLSMSANPAEPTALNIRYQVGFGDTARECRLAPGNLLSMRVGIEGRVILGPAGNPGQLDVPVRLAVVREGVTPRTVATKLHRVPVTIPPDSTNVLFTYIEEDLTFPMPKGNEIDAYVVYVGFDPLGAQEMDRRRSPARPAGRPARADAAPALRAPL
jgi:hypothetical protein